MDGNTSEVTVHSQIERDPVQAAIKNFRTALGITLIQEMRRRREGAVREMLGISTHTYRNLMEGDLKYFNTDELLSFVVKLNCTMKTSTTVSENKIVGITLSITPRMDVPKAE